MERLRHEGLHNFHDDLERQSDDIIVLGDLEMSQDLLHFYPWKSRCQLLHC